MYCSLIRKGCTTALSSKNPEPPLTFKVPVLPNIYASSPFYFKTHDIQL